MSNPNTTPLPHGPGTAVPEPLRAASAETREPTTDLGVLETLAAAPVAEHLAIFEDLHASLLIDLDATSQGQA